MILLALVGCGSLGLESTGPLAGAEDGLTIERIEPSWGPPSEDTEVTITGTGMDGATSVFFGRSEVAITKIDAETIVATAPATDIEAVVDVRVVGDDGEDTLKGGFTYSEDEPEDTDTDTDGGGNDDADGKIGGLVQFSLTQYACPDCVGLTEDLDVYAVGGFHEPGRKSWFDWLPAEGSCAANPVSESAADSFIDAGEWMYLTSGSRSVAMRAASDHIFSADSVGEADFVRNAAYDLSIPDGGSGLDAFERADALTTPQSISELTPVEMLYTDPRQAFTARVSKNNATFTWGPTGGGGSFVIELGVYDGRTGDPLGSVVCRGPDDGSMTVPAGQLSTYPSGSLLLIGLHRYVLGTFDRPDNGSEVETLATFGVVGTGVLQ